MKMVSRRQFGVHVIGGTGALALSTSPWLFATPTSRVSLHDRRVALEKAIEGFPDNVHALLRSIVLQDDFVGVFSREQVHDLAIRLGLGEDQIALALISLARVYAIPPISHFYVGAIALGGSGAMYFGANMEFPGQALSFSVHAEQAATMNAWMHGEQGLKSIAITAPPCGYCRQFLNELSTAENLTILLRDMPPVSLRTLLPQPFGPLDLGMTLRLMDQSIQPLQQAAASNDPVIATALAAASTSYAPYSGNYAGVAIQSMEGVIVSGRYAENAAYNPSMSPLAAALVLYNFAQQDLLNIHRVVLVQTQDDTANQRDASIAVLSTLADHPKLEVYTAISVHDKKL